MAEDNSYVQPGDLIEIHRPLYQHWALYVGDGFVIHVTDEEDPSIWASSSSMSATRAKVKKELLKKVVGNNKWCVNNKYDRSRTPRPVKEILRSAERWVNREVPYGVLSSNCEHFVTKLRYGEPVSDQADAAIFGGAAAAVVGIVGTVAAVAVELLSKGTSRM